MLTEHNIITFQDKKGKNDVVCEINLLYENKNTIRMVIGGKESYIKVKDFYGVCLMLVKGKQLDDILINKERKVKKYKRQIKVVAQKDIKKGEEIIVTYEVNVPTIVKDNENIN